MFQIWWKGMGPKSSVLLCFEIKSLKFGFKDQLRGRHWDAQRGEIGKGRDMNKKVYAQQWRNSCCVIFAWGTAHLIVLGSGIIFPKTYILGIFEHKFSKRVEKRDHSPLDWIFWPPTGKEGLCFKCVKLFLHQIIFRPLVFCHEIVGDSGIFCPGGRRWL